MEEGQQSGSAWGMRGPGGQRAVGAGTRSQRDEHGGAGPTGGAGAKP